MEFWGVEVKPGEPLKIKPELFKLIHISQAALGEVKDRKGAKYVPIHLKVGDKKYVLGTLSAEDRPQLMFDLVFEREFELSHDWKDGSIYFVGYVADESDDLESNSDVEDFSDEDEDEDNQVDALQNGKLEPELHGVKPATKKNLPVKAKPLQKLKAKLMEPKKSESESDEDDDDSDVSGDSDDKEGEDSSELEEDSSDALADMGLVESMDDSDDENQDLVSKKAQPIKKRQSDTATEILAPAAKKTKSAGGRTPATNGKSKENNPKPGGQLSSKSCSKTFNSENALQSHSKAKHGGK